MTDLKPSDILFVGMGQSAVAWYRCALPATFLGADWCGLADEPPELKFLVGQVKGQTRLPAFDDYKVVVLQQPRGNGWLKVIHGLRERGVKVVFEVDDYLHGIRKLQDHDYKEHFDREQLTRLESCMRVSDALICSTDFIARKYKAFNKHTYVCENGLDLGRYQLTRPERETVNVGFAGATGHVQSVTAWMGAVVKVMQERPNVAFISIGQDFASGLLPHFPGRALAIPWTLVDLYPGAMTMLDIAIAPAGKGLFFRGKSDLRWLEAGALGIPIIADPLVYPKITPGVDGFHAETPEQVYDHLVALVDDAELRTRVGEAAREYVVENRRMQLASQRWLDVLEQVVG